jgi:hypothetical protein
MMDKVDKPDADKTECIKLEFLIDPDNTASKYSRQFAIFKDACNISEEWIKWVISFREIENLLPRPGFLDFVEGSSLALF